MQELEQPVLQNLEQIAFGVSLIHLQLANLRPNLWPKKNPRDVTSLFPKANKFVWQPTHQS